jgi:hypothetical protein
VEGNIVMDTQPKTHRVGYGVGGVKVDADEEDAGLPGLFIVGPRWPSLSFRPQDA